jgi:lipoyl(octanoyl) transferase
MLEHSPVFTTGRSGGVENLLIDGDELTRLGIELHRADRGGNITYHGPGQLVAYPVFNLEKWRKDLPWYVSSLEEVVIQVLSDYGVEAGRKPKYRGVWVDERKIAAVGIAVKRWITTHGLAFNIEVNKSHFELINPCGLKGLAVVSLNDFISHVNFSEVVDKMEEKFSLVFDTKFIKVPGGWLDGDIYA